MLDPHDILAGPILRRVERNLVSVWIALSKPASVIIEVYRGLGKSSELGAPVAAKTPASNNDIHTVPFGANFHVVVAMWESFAPAGLDLGQIHSYDLIITPDGDQPQKLKDLGLLSDRTQVPQWLALGYQDGFLPSFATPPVQVADLKIVQGSCRGANGEGRDALPPLDNLVRGAVTDPKLRPHMLFLTGDQIYADESGAEQLEMLQKVSEKLLGGKETIRVEFPKTDAEPAAIATFPLDTAHFPPGRRGHPLNDIAGFTSTSTDSHCMGFGEYCALYLAGWSNTTWEWDPAPLLKQRKDQFTVYTKLLGKWFKKLDDYTKAHPDKDGDMIESMIPYHDAWRLVPPQYRVIDAALEDKDRDAAWGKGTKDDNDNFLLWQEFASGSPPDDPSVPNGFEDKTKLPAGNTPQELSRLARALTPSWFAGRKYFNVAFEKTKEAVDPQTYKVTTKADAVYNKLSRLDWFFKDLPRVRRLLANIPTYMIFDDHEVTDDWNITPGWIKHTRANALGRGVIRNGLAAYTVCQGWGNDPRAFRDNTPGRKALDLIKEMFSLPEPANAGPIPEEAARLERLFDINPITEPRTPTDERMKWNYHYEGPGYEVIVLDTRTWRGYEPNANPQIQSKFGDDATATLLSDEALRLQIPEQPALGVNPDGVCFVIAAAPFLGFPVIETIVQPLINLHDIAKARKPGPPFVRWQKTFSVGRVERDPENWGYEPSLFEAALARLATRRRVVFLSGDVHYGFTLQGAYWQFDPPLKIRTITRLAQLTASSFRAQRDDLSPILAMDLVQQLAALSSTQERIGWHRGPLGSPTAGPPLLAKTQVFSPHLQLTLGEDPIVVSPPGVPDDRQIVRPQEWAWRTGYIGDTRPDTERLASLHPPPFVNGADFNAIRSVAERHVWQAQNAMPRGWQWWTMFTTVEFTATPDGKLDSLIHRIYGFNPLDDNPTAMENFVSASVPMNVTEEPPKLTGQVFG